MNVTISVKEHIVGFYVAMDNVVAMNITQSTSKLRYPEADRIFGKRLSRNVKSQIAAAHEIDNEVPVEQKRGLSVPGEDVPRTGLCSVGECIHVFDILEAIS